MESVQESGNIKSDAKSEADIDAEPAEGTEADLAETPFPAEVTDLELPQGDVDVRVPGNPKTQLGFSVSSTDHRLNDAKVVNPWISRG